MTIAPSTRISIPPGVLVRDLDGESVVLNVETEKYFGLDEVGTRMFSALKAAGSVEEACRALAVEYDVDAQRLQEDLAALVNELAAHGLVTVVDPVGDEQG